MDHNNKKEIQNNLIQNTKFSTTSNNDVQRKWYRFLKRNVIEITKMRHVSTKLE